MSKVKYITSKIIGYTITSVVFLIALPFALAFVILQSFWKVFGATVIAFILIGLFGGTIEECLTYSMSLGFFVGVGLLFFKKEKN
jgi:hypothetical protein